MSKVIGHRLKLILELKVKDAPVVLIAELIPVVSGPVTRNRANNFCAHGLVCVFGALARRNKMKS